METGTIKIFNGNRFSPATYNRCFNFVFQLNYFNDILDYQAGSDPEDCYGESEKVVVWGGVMLRDNLFMLRFNGNPYLLGPIAATCGRS